MPRMPKTFKPNVAKGRSVKRFKDPDPNFYKKAAWLKLRRVFLAHYPLCADPMGNHPDQVVEAQEVHHLKPRVERPDLALDWNNLQGLCKSCHSKETRREQLEGRT